MIVGLIEIVRSCGMEMNVGKTKVKRIPIQPFLLYIIELANEEKFSHLVSLIIKDAMCCT